MRPHVSQLINLFAAVLLLVAFAMLSQRRVLSLVRLFTLQGAALVAAAAVMAYATAQPHLYYSAALTLLLKVLLLPWILHRLIDRLNVKWDVEPLLNIPTTMLIGIVLVVFAFSLAAPISQLSLSVARSTLGIALAAVRL
jgi:hydrogenase-4 component E